MHSDDDSLNSYISKASVMLEKFHSHEMPIFPWLNKLESVADYVGVPDHKMAEFLYSMLESPEDLNITKEESSGNSFNYSYEEVKAKFFHCYAYMNITKLARERFRARVQYEHETVEKYAESLKKLFDECSYKGEYRSKLRNKFVHGLYDDDLRISFKNIRYLRFNEAVKKAVIMRDMLKMVKEVPYKRNADRHETKQKG
ncbi:hypothetical protein M0804_013725 [Polistes exclamans]|nr:hypothetical protein M0804_013725 [Polistes exclamans]